MKKFIKAQRKLGKRISPEELSTVSGGNQNQSLRDRIRQQIPDLKETTRRALDELRRN